LRKQHESTEHQNLYLGAGSSKPPQLLSHSCIVRGKLSGVESLEQKLQNFIELEIARDRQLSIASSS
jgi:hypothetical protein